MTIYRVTSEARPCFRWEGTNLDEAEEIAFKVAANTGQPAYVSEEAGDE